MLFDSEIEWGKLEVRPMQTNRMKTLLSSVEYWRKARSLRSANSSDVLHPVCLPGLALVWRVRLLPVTRCRSDVGPDEARPNSLPLDRIIPIESAHAIVEASN